MRLYQNLDGAKIIHEGSGADVKYYAQLGADAASKKLLGNPTILYKDFEGTSFSVTLSQLDTAATKIIACGILSFSFGTGVDNNWWRIDTTASCTYTDTTASGEASSWKGGDGGYPSRPYAAWRVWYMI